MPLPTRRRPPRRDELLEQLLPRARSLVELVGRDGHVMASAITPVTFDERTLEARITRVRGSDGVWITCVQRKPYVVPVEDLTQLDLLELFAGSRG